MLHSSNPSINKPALSKLEKPTGPSIILRLCSFPNSITESINSFVTSKSSITSNQPNLTLLFLISLISIQLIIAAIRPTIFFLCKLEKILH